MASAADAADAAVKKQASGFGLLDAAIVKAGGSQESALRRLNALAAQADDVERAFQRLSRAENDLNRAIEQGYASEERKVQVMDQLWQKLLGAAQAQEQLNRVQRAAASQASINTQLGVRDDFNTAGDRKSVV